MKFNRPKLKFWTLGFLVLMLSLETRAEIHLSEDGGYSNIVVRISDQLDMNKCSDIIASLKSLLDQTSSALHSALWGRVYLRSATIVIPSSWPSGVCGLTPAMFETENLGTDIRDPDIEIGTADIFHGYYPHTRQSGGCGVPGDLVSVPATWLTTNNITMREARTFLHLWSKYRYGIFDDTGFSADRLYPSFYRKDGNIVPSIAHNGVLTGTWLRNGEECEPDIYTDNGESTDCVFVPDNVHSSEVSCSLGNGLGLSEAVRYCNATESWLSPTKQAIVCGGRSAVDVILSHPDFATLSDVSPRDVTTVRPEIKIAQAPVTKYILALETSSAMADTEHWGWVTKAAHKFIREDLPVNSHLAVMTFSDQRVKVEHGLVEVTSDEVRTVLADTIPGRYHLSTKETGRVLCVSCVLDTLDSVLGPGSHSGLHLVLITTATSGSQEERERMTEILGSRSVRMSSVIIPSRDSGHSLEMTTFYDQLTQASGGRSFPLSETGYGIDLLVGLNTAFEAVLRAENVEASEVSETVHQSEHYTNTGDNESAGAFIIDESLGRDTVFGIYVQDEEDHLIKSVTFQDSDGNNYGPFTKMSSAMDPFNIKTINYVGEEPPFGNARWVGRQWRYTIKWSGAGARVSKNIVMVSSKPRRSVDAVRVSVWVGDMAREMMGPVPVYTRVSVGQQPVLGATVYLDIEVENSNGTVFVLLPSLMRDNGHGEPDMTGDDGVYSGYIPSYPSDGRYKVSVRVSSSSETASTFPQGEVTSRSPMCCGSSTRAQRSKMIPAMTFTRRLAGPALLLTNTEAVPSLAPTRVTDLRVTSDNGGVLRALWSSEDRTVMSYKFVFSANIADLIDATAHPQVLRELAITELESRAEEMMLSTELLFSLYGRDYYLALVSVSTSGRHSGLSNIVHVYQQPPVIPESELLGASASGASYDLLQPVTDRDWIMVAVVCAIFAVLLCVTVVMTAYLCWYKHKRSRAKVSRTSGSSSDVNVVSSGSSDQTDATSFDLDMKNLCPSNNESPPPGYDLSITRVTEHHVTQRDRDPSPGSRVTPIYWSASQLLSKLDTDPGGFAHHSLYHHKDAVIPDEFCVTVSDLHVPPHHHRGHRTYSDSSLGFSDCDTRGHNDTKMPPPVFPKPKNITQV